MAKCLQILFRVPFSDCSGVIQWMRLKGGRICCAQHDADEDVKTTHCHVAWEPPVTNEAIRKQCITNSLGGQKYSILEKVVKTHELYEFMELAKYCIKGDPKQVCETSLTQSEVEDLAKKWVNRTKKLDVDLTKHDIITGETIKMQESSSGTEWEKLMSALRKRPDAQKMNMADIKRWIKSYYLGFKRPIPRNGDLNRYSYSLWAIQNSVTSYEDIFKADEQADSHMI